MEDADFAWMLGMATSNRDLRLPPGGVDHPSILQHVRDIVRGLREAGCRGAWMVVADGKVVGLCSYKAPPANGQVEIGYGMAASRWGLGHATRAVALMLQVAHADPLIHVVVAETVVANVASARVLEKNGFARTGTRMDEHDGETVMWSRLARAVHLTS